MPKISSRRKVRGTARTTALKLFGIPGKMESPSDRENICLILRHSPNPRVQALCRQAADEIYRGTSFATLCENLGLNYHDVAKEFKEIQRSIGYMRSAAHLPELMEQAMLEAKPTTRPCKRCDGTGHIMIEVDKKVPGSGRQVDCPSCEGKGTWVQPSDIDRLKVALEMMGTLNQRGAGVAVNLDLRNTDKPETLESLSESIGPLLEGKIIGPEGEPTQ